jgi:hypothetical protein
MHSLEQLAREWADKVESYRLTHYAFGDRFRLWNNIVGTPASSSPRSSRPDC